MLNLDTHVLVYALEGDVKKRERTLLESERWGIASIVLWEIAKLIELGRLEMDLDDPTVDAALASLHVWPLDLAVARASTSLDFAGDPAEQIIVATSIVHGAPLLTRDRRIRRSKLVPLA